MHNYIDYEPLQSPLAAFIMCVLRAMLGMGGARGASSHSAFLSLLESFKIDQPCQNLKEHHWYTGLEGRKASG